MASFNPQISDTGVIDMTGVSRGPGVNRAFETLFSGLSDTAENALKIKDTSTQLDIQDQAQDMFNSVNSEFGLQPPDGMTDGLDQIQTLKNAVDQGKLSEVNYYGRLATLSKQLRSRFPGYESIVDSTIQNVTGTRPANAYRDAILQEYAQARADASSEDKFQRQYEKENEGIISTLYPDYFENPGKYTFDQLRIGVSKYKAKDEAIGSRLKELQLNASENNFNEVQTKKTIDQDFSFITQSFLTSATNANDPSFQQKINEFTAKGGGSPDEINQFVSLISQAETTLRARLYQRGQQEYVGHGILGNDDLNKAIDNAMYPLTKAKEAVLGGDFKLASKYSTLNKVIEDKQMNDLFQDPDVRIGAGMSKINSDLGAEWFNKTGDDIFGRVQDGKSGQIAEEIVGRTMNGDTNIISKTVDQGDSGLTKATLNKAYSVITDENSTPDNVHQMVQSIFGPSAKNWMDRRVVDPADMETLYTKFLDPKTTKAIFQKGSEEDKQTYLQWAMTSARAIPEFAAAAGDFNSINANLKGWNTNIQLAIDPKTMKVTATSDRGPEYAAAASKYLGRQLNSLNKVFSVLGPIMDAAGEDKEKVAKDFIRSLSINIDGVDPESQGPDAQGKKGFWSWMYDGLSQPLGKAIEQTGQKRPTIEGAVVPEIIQDAASGLAQVGSDLMQPIPRSKIAEVEAPDSGELNFFEARADSNDSINDESVVPTNGKWLLYANKGATRSEPLSKKLVNALGDVVPELGLTMKVFSGGQEAEGSKRTGSHRHDHGNAADVFFYKDGRKLNWSDPQDRPLFEEIVKRARRAGITGIGAGPGYMREGSMHIGFGSEAAWGAGGKGKNAPAWLLKAFNS